MTRPTPKSRLAIAALLVVAIMAPAAQVLAAEPGDVATAVVAERRYVPLGYWLIQRLRERLGIVPLRWSEPAAAAGTEGTGNAGSDAAQTVDTGSAGSGAGEVGVSETAAAGSTAAGAASDGTGGSAAAGTDANAAVGAGAGDTSATESAGTEAGTEPDGGAAAEAGAAADENAGADEADASGATDTVDAAAETAAGIATDESAQAGAVPAHAETEAGTGEGTAAGNSGESLRNALLYQLLGQMLADRGMGDLLPTIQALEAARDAESGQLSSKGQRELGRVLLVMSMGHVQGQLLFEAIDSTFHPEDYQS